MKRDLKASRQVGLFRSSRLLTALATPVTVVFISVCLIFDEAAPTTFLIGFAVPLVLDSDFAFFSTGPASSFTSCELLLELGTSPLPAILRFLYQIEITIIMVYIRKCWRKKSINSIIYKEFFGKYIELVLDLLNFKKYLQLCNERTTLRKLANNLLERFPLYSKSLVYI